MPAPARARPDSRALQESRRQQMGTSMRRATLRLYLAVLVPCLLVGSPAGAQPTDYVIGPQDGLAITVWNQADLGGTYTVEADGTFTLPLIGRVQAGGLTLREFEATLIERLADGYFKTPQVTVAVEDYRSQRIFVVGEVRSPGTYPLTGGMTLIEALASAGSTTNAASTEALIVQATRDKTALAPGAGDLGEGSGPTLPGDSDDAHVISVDIEALQSGRAAQNVALRDGDTIFIPRAETVYVTGNVTAPGVFPIRRGTTVLQALALAGGATEFGATNRIKIIRVVKSEQRELKVKLSDQVHAGDTIVVPERFF